MKLLEDELGAKLEVGVQLRAELDPNDLLRERIKTRLRVVSCTNCDLHRQCTGPVSMEVGERAELLVVGEAPGVVEDERRVPFVGPAGKLMRAMLTQAGFDLETVAFCNTVSCWPQRTPAAPTVEEMRACRANLRDQVVASGATYIVLAGGVATQAWRSDLKVSDIHGQVFVWGNSWIIMPVWHPAAILRDPSKRGALKADLAKFHEIVAGDRGLTDLGTKCVKCGDTMDHYDPDGVPWCQRHWARHGGQWKREWARWTNDKAVKRTDGVTHFTLQETPGQGMLEM